MGTLVLAQSTSRRRWTSVAHTARALSLAIRATSARSALAIRPKVAKVVSYVIYFGPYVILFGTLEARGQNVQKTATSQLPRGC